MKRWLALLAIVVVVAVTACGGARQAPSAPSARPAAISSAAASLTPAERCQIAVLALLEKTVTAMEDGYSGGIDVNQVMAQHGEQSVVFQAFIQTDGLVMAYVDQHGPTGSVGSVSGQVISLCAQYGASPALPPNVTPSASAPASQPAASYPTPTPEYIGPPGCPGSAPLMAAWNAAPASAFRSQGIGKGLSISGFNDISCWRGWVVASPIANANGTAEFSEQGGLHMLSGTEMRQFNNAVCSSRDSPTAWKNPAAGPATCSP